MALMPLLVADAVPVGLVMLAVTLPWPSSWMVTVFAAASPMTNMVWPSVTMFALGQQRCSSASHRGTKLRGRRLPLTWCKSIATPPLKKRAFRMEHASRMNCLGFTMERDGVRLGYSGDAKMSAELEALVAASDHVITEMTHDDEGGAIHLGRRDVEALMQRHPSTRFIITHRGGNGSLDGAVIDRKSVV